MKKILLVIFLATTIYSFSSSFDKFRFDVTQINRQYNYIKYYITNYDKDFKKVKYQVIGYDQRHNEILIDIITIKNFNYNATISETSSINSNIKFNEFKLIMLEYE